MGGCFSPGISCKVYLKTEIFLNWNWHLSVTFRWEPSNFQVTFCLLNMVETQCKTTINQFLKHGLKKPGPSIKPRGSFICVSQRKIARDIHFFKLFPFTSPSYCYYHEQYHSLLLQESFVSKIPLKNLYFQFHSFLARNSPGWTFRVPSWVNEWPLVDLIYLSLFSYMWFILQVH